MKKFIILCLCIFTSGTVSADFYSQDETRKFTDKMMANFVSGEFEKGLDKAKSHWPVPEVEIDGMANQIQMQWPMISQRFGKSLSSEFVGEARVGNSLIRYYFLHKFEKHAIYWQVDFYKAADTWRINTVRFMDNLEPLFALSPQ